MAEARSQRQTHTSFANQLLALLRMPNRASILAAHNSSRRWRRCGQDQSRASCHTNELERLHWATAPKSYRLHGPAKKFKSATPAPRTSRRRCHPVRSGYRKEKQFAFKARAKCQDLRFGPRFGPNANATRRLNDPMKRRKAQSPANSTEANGAKP